MISKIVDEVRAVGYSFGNAILCPLEVDAAKHLVKVKIITDRVYTPTDKTRVEQVLKKNIPSYFNCNLEIEKLTPDCDMVKRKIAEIIGGVSMPVYSTLKDDDITVEKTENGFSFSVATTPEFAGGLVEKICDSLSVSYCGEFTGTIVSVKLDVDSLHIEETEDEIAYETPIRRFEIENFEFLEGENIRKTAVYIADLNLVSDEVVLCGVIVDIRERTYKNKQGQEKVYYNFIIDDGTGRAQITYFTRLKSLEKIKALQVGDSIVVTGLNEQFNGNLRYTGKTIDRGEVPKNFVPEKRQSRPVPACYHTVKPQQYVDMNQADFFSSTELPVCLKENDFVVFDLETTGLNSSPVYGNMDRIIEIGAYKIRGGEIKESFTTFINPERKLSDEIIKLTGITQEMVQDAPVFEEVMPDFFKFCAGSILVGHNIAGFDFKFVDYYCARLGYILDRKIIDTLQLSQELLYLSNYKLNTVADKFNITFNHHRAIDDALATAKIFIELIKLKKSLPKI